MSVDLSQLKRRVRRSYEKQRMVHALSRCAPLLAVGAAVLVLDRRPAIVLSVDALLFATSAALLWRGQQAGRGMTAGLFAGAIPLLLGVCMQGYQHLCNAPTLMPGCTAVCSAGGFVAGVWIAWIAGRRSAPLAFLLSAGAVAVLTGGLGCVCAGVGGLFGLAGGMALPLIARQLRVVPQGA